jgi:hypothetical protein
MRRLLGTVVLVVGIAGCASVKTLEATGGSRSDGTVELSYEYGSLEAPAGSIRAGLAHCQGKVCCLGVLGRGGVRRPKGDLSDPRHLSVLAVLCNRDVPMHRQRRLHPPQRPSRPPILRSGSPSFQGISWALIW